ncbi:hypothetical protein [Actinophytocola oryzae]|uniref:Uncharacterized protein n=1 Tax=Actinophytocola oryzae TaxID=502181 RepID=A0A4R7W2U4_9PSEU|nr:hypothetical protein [Actinophytocola oryzae]TDV56465.1 hypothetical protein CLV71_102532 [Actinophytocola oryzae]
MRIRVALVALALFFAGAPAAVADPVWAPQVNDVKEKLETDCGQAWFWSGRTAGVSVRAYAENAAAKNDGYTLAAKLKEQQIPEPTTDQGWREYSKYFAQGAKCEAFAVVGEDLRPGNIWEEVEYPTLKANPLVAYVWRVDTRTDEACVLWQKPTMPDQDCFTVDK